MAERTVEGDRNRLLRRVDWRFLLRDPEPERVICFASGELAEAVAQIAGEVVLVGDARSDPGGVAPTGTGADRDARRLDAPAPAGGGATLPADLAVVVDPDPNLLRQAFASLAPGGAIYVEWHATMGTSPPAAERKLRAAGFRSVRFYTPHPSPPRARPESWIPLDTPGPVRFAFDTRPPARTRTRAIGRGIQRRAWIAGRWLRRASTLCAIAVRPFEGGAEGDPRAVGDLRTPVRAGAGERLASTVRGIAFSGGDGGAVTSGLKPGAVDNVVTTPHPDIPSRTRAQPEEVAPRTTFEDDIGCPWDVRILDGWSEWGFGRRPERLSTLLLTGGRRSINKVVALVFGGAEGVPRVAVKVPRVPEAAVTVAREAEALEALAIRAPALSGVPRVLFRGAGGETPYVGQSVILGRRVTRLLVEKKSFSDLALQATAWQIGLGESTLRHPPTDLLQRVIEPVIQDFEMNYGHVVDSGMLREAAARVSALASLPTVVEQRDFSPWNLLCTDDGSLAVLDWESSELEGVPGADLVYLLTYLAIYQEGAHEPGRDEEAYARVGSPDTPTGGVARDCWLEYASRLGLSPDILPAVRLFTWMLHSRSAHARLTGDVGGTPEEAALRNSIFVRFWRSELRRRA